MKNSELVNTSDRFLTAIEKQRKFLTQLHSQPRPCPNCGNMLNFYEGLGIDMDDYDYIEAVSEGGVCTKCQRKLKLVVPFISLEGWHWSLVPIEPGDVELLAQAERGYEDE